MSTSVCCSLAQSVQNTYLWVSASALHPQSQLSYSPVGAAIQQGVLHNSSTRLIPSYRYYTCWWVFWPSLASSARSLSSCCQVLQSSPAGHGPDPVWLLCMQGGAVAWPNQACTQTGRTQMLRSAAALLSLAHPKSWHLYSPAELVT